MRNVLRPLALAALAATLAAADGCILFVPNSADQCESDGDCTSKGVAFQGAFCNANKVCQSSLSYCSSNQQCYDRNGQQPYICRQGDHTCQPLTTPECTSLFQENVTPPEWLNDNVVIFGALLDGPTNPLLLGALNSVDMARHEFMTTTNGLPGSANQPAKPIVFVACLTKSNDPAVNLKASKHLVEDLGVAGIVGPAFPSSLGQLLSQEMIPKQAVSAVPAFSSAQLNDLPGRGQLLIRNGGIDADQAHTVAPLIKTFVEPLVHKQLNIPTATPIKFAILQQDSSLGQTYGSTIANEAVFNGVSASQNQASGRFTQIIYGDPTASDYSQKVAQAITQVLQFLPNLVYIASTPEGANLISLIESMWPTGASAPPRPFYFVTPPVNATIAQTIAGASSPDDLRRRVLGEATGSPSSDANRAQYVTRYSTFTFGDKASTVSGGIFAASTYDNAWLLMLGAAAVEGRKKPLNGPNLGNAIVTALADPAQPKVAPETDGSTNSVLSQLLNGQTINYDGVSGPNDFDSKGDAPTDDTLWCVGQDNSIQENGIVYRYKTNAIEGSNDATKCPQFM